MTDTTAIKALLAENRWRAIEDAPRDGTEILALCPDRPEGKQQSVVFWLNDSWAFYAAAEGEFQLNTRDRLTHFRTLPTDDLADVAQVLLDAMCATLEENGHLADGDNCTLIRLKQSLSRANEIAGKK
jgi:hypothetical protein